MGRPRKLDRWVYKKTYLPQSVMEAVERELFSEIEGKIPYGAWNTMIEEAVRDWLLKRGIQL